MATASSALDCAVCLQECLHAVRLPCQHIFCFLCIKGAALMNKHCPLCRAEVPMVYFNSPDLLEKRLSIDSDEKYHWYYQGVNGWWLYDERTALELETGFQDGKPLCQILVSGMTYVIDYNQMVQVRKHHPNRVRRVKRDVQSAVETKGIAGIRLAKEASGSTEETINFPDDTQIRTEKRSAYMQSSLPSSPNDPPSLINSQCSTSNSESTTPSLRSDNSSSNRVNSGIQTTQIDDSDILTNSLRNLSLNSCVPRRKD